MNGARHSRAKVVGGWLLGLAIAAYALSGTYRVRPDEEMVVRRFGAALPTTARPGLHWGLPWPMERRSRVQVQKKRVVQIGTTAAAATTGLAASPDESQFLTGDRNLVRIEMAVQYAVEDPVAFLFASTDAGTLVRDAAEAGLARAVATKDVDVLMTGAKRQVQTEVRQYAQRRLEALGSGVVITSTNIQRVAAPSEVAAAFEDVVSAAQDKERYVAEAEGERSRTLLEADGQAAQLLAEAAIFSERRLNESEGEAERFAKQLEEYALAPRVTRERLYMDAIEEILAKTKQLVVGEGADRSIDLSLFRSGP